jgi:creatinine amidohydrolase
MINMDDKKLWCGYTTNQIKEIIETKDPLVIIPVGSTEQHGPHLTLDTDTDIGFQIAKDVAKNSPITTLVLPSIWAGFSEHHMAFSGTITLKQSTLSAVLIDIIESLKRHGISKIMILNSHGGNIPILSTVINEVGYNHGIYPILLTYWQLIGDQIKSIRKSNLNGMSHACELETSLKMFISPHDVEIDLLSDTIIEEDYFYNVDMFASNKISLYKPFDQWTVTGQIGESTSASRETGEKIYKAVLCEMLKVITHYWN